MTRIYIGDLDDLRAAGWETGAYWSGPGASGYWIRHPDECPEWTRVAVSPAGDDSISDEGGYVGPSGGHDTATEALMDRLALEATDGEEG